MRKGQGLSLNVIVIAAIALIVLVVLVIIFSGKVGQFRKGTTVCGGKCVASPSLCEPDENPIYISDCDANGDGKADNAGWNYCCTAY